MLCGGGEVVECYFRATAGKQRGIHVVFISQSRKEGEVDSLGWKSQPNCLLVTPGPGPMHLSVISWRFSPSSQLLQRNSKFRSQPGPKVKQQQTFHRPQVPDCSHASSRAWARKAGILKTPRRGQEGRAGTWLCSFSPLNAGNDKRDFFKKNKSLTA